MALAGDTHLANAFTVDPATGALQPHGEPVSLPSRPIHTSVDRQGEFLLTAYNIPSHVTVHRLEADGSIGELVHQPAKLDTGIYAHQVLTTPSQSDGDPGHARQQRGTPASRRIPARSSSTASSAAYSATWPQSRPAPATASGRGTSIFIRPSRGSMSRSSGRTGSTSIRCRPDGRSGRDPLFTTDTIADKSNLKPAQQCGPIHIHPNGRFVYVTNRCQGEVEVDGSKVFNDGQNNIAVFAIDQQSGEPTLIQTVDGHGIHLRTFGIDPGGRLLVAASIRPILVRDGNATRTLTAGLMVYRVGDDGRLTFVRKYDVDTAKGQQFWSGMATIG